MINASPETIKIIIHILIVLVSYLLLKELYNSYYVKTNQHINNIKLGDITITYKNNTRFIICNHCKQPMGNDSFIGYFELNNCAFSHYKCNHCKHDMVFEFVNNKIKILEGANKELYENILKFRGLKIRTDNQNINPPIRTINNKNKELYEVIHMDIINATNEVNGQEMYLYINSKGEAFVREKKEFDKKFKIDEEYYS